MDGLASQEDRRSMTVLLSLDIIDSAPKESCTEFIEV